MALIYLGNSLCFDEGKRGGYLSIPVDSPGTAPEQSLEEVEDETD